eukprot:scaffold9092_cov120-Skeletonema_marinoi.AAC.1
MSEREKENQHRWLKMQAKHAAIQVRLETDHRSQQRRITSNSNKAWGENRGGRGQKGLLSASANLTGNADHRNQQRRITSNVNKAVGRSVGAGGQKLRPQ